MHTLIISFKVKDGEPYVMWLSGLHIPESYLTALVQATCRKNGWPLDRSTLYTAVTEVCLPVHNECITTLVTSFVVHQC